ncbi:hypothetical protein ACN0TX_12055 [Staphylococcus cohnii]|uniref:hypothetical protein n=1 Tax=Staphylococcus cohnii TaxID=29382 RepID=UPI003AF6A285
MAKAKKQTIESLEKKVISPIEKLNLENIDFGEVVLDTEKNQLVLKDETSFNQIVKDLTNFIDDLKEAKEEYTQNKINEVVLEKLNNGGSDADIVKQLFNESEDDSNNKVDVNTEKEQNEFNNVEQNN